MKYGQLMPIVVNNVFREYFSWCRSLSPSTKPFLIYQLTEILKNQ